MLNDKGAVLYVGKARNLIRRVGSYTQPNRLSNRILRMVSETEKLEVIITKSEIEHYCSNPISSSKCNRAIIFCFVMTKACRKFCSPPIMNLAS